MTIKRMLLLVFSMACLAMVAQEETRDISPVTNERAADQATLVLSLDAAKDFALQHNREVKNAGLAVTEAEKKVWETLASGLPQVSANLDYTDYLGHKIYFPGSTDGLPNNPTSFFNVDVSQLIFSGTYIIGLQTAKLYKAMSEKNVQKSELEVKEQVANAYFLILLSERTKDILVQNLENVREVHRNTEAMYKVGVTEQTDVDQLSIQVTMLENTLRQTERQVDMAYDMLRLQLGVNRETNLQLTQSLDIFLLSFDFYHSLVKEFDLNSNVDFQLMESQEEIMAKEVSMRKMEHLPTISANYRRTEKIKAANFDMQPNNVMSFNMTIPVFSSGMRKAKVNQAKIQLETARNNKEQVRDALLIQERQARLNLNTALEHYNSQEKNVEVANRVYKSINRKFQNGLVSSLDLTTAHNNYLAAESDYIQSMLNVLEAYTALEKLFNNL